eukprot:2307117-Rhodomonas_salina.2
MHTRDPHKLVPELVVARARAPQLLRRDAQLPDGTFATLDFERFALKSKVCNALPGGMLLFHRVKLHGSKDVLEVQLAVAHAHIVVARVYDPCGLIACDYVERLAVHVHLGDVRVALHLFQQGVFPDLVALNQKYC